MQFIHTHNYSINVNAITVIDWHHMDSEGHISVKINLTDGNFHLLPCDSSYFKETIESLKVITKFPRIIN